MEESAGGGEVKLRGGSPGSGPLGVRSKELVFHTLIKERLQNFRENETGGREKDMMMSE